MSDKIDRDLLLSLADLLKETGLGELEVEVDGLRALGPTGACGGGRDGGRVGAAGHVRASRRFG